MARENFEKIEYKNNRRCWQTYPDLCKSCGICILKCPVKALTYDDKKNEYLGMPAVKCDIEKCIACGTCERVCPDMAIKVTGRK